MFDEAFDDQIAMRRICCGRYGATRGTLFPYVSHQLSGMQFQAIEAVVSATLGFGISSVLG